MSSLFEKFRFLILRRAVQILLLLLYFGANAWGWSILVGNLSASELFGFIPLADPFALLQMLIAGASLSSSVIVGALIIAIFFALLGGRVFCSWVCPVNIVVDFANWLRRKISSNEQKKGFFVLRTTRYWALGLSFIISLFLGVAAFEMVSPISIVHRGVVFGFGLGWGALLMVLLFDLFIQKNGWCGHLCPLGAFYSLIGKFGFIRVSHKYESCTECMECKTVCPEKHVLHMVGKESLQVSSSECTNCGRCIEVCNDDALNFYIRNFLDNGESNDKK